MRALVLAAGRGVVSAAVVACLRRKARLWPLRAAAPLLTIGRPRGADRLLTAVSGLIYWLAREGRKGICLRRRELIALIGGAAGWTISARGRQPRRYDRSLRWGIARTYGHGGHRCCGSLSSCHRQQWKLLGHGTRPMSRNRVARSEGRRCANHLR